MLGLFAVHNRHWYRFDGLDPRVPDYSPIAVSDVRTHNNAPMAWTRSPGWTIGWEPVVPPEPNTVVVQGTSLQQVEDALKQAVAVARRNGPGARVLLLRTWVINDENNAWQTALEPYTLSYPYSGVEPVTIIANP